jgi:hypothetical protein
LAPSVFFSSLVCLNAAQDRMFSTTPVFTTCADTPCVNVPIGCADADVPMRACLLHQLLRDLALAAEAAHLGRQRLLGLFASRSIPTVASAHTRDGWRASGMPSGASGARLGVEGWVFDEGVDKHPQVALHLERLHARRLVLLQNALQQLAARSAAARSAAASAHEHASLRTSAERERTLRRRRPRSWRACRP